MEAHSKPVPQPGRRPSRFWVRWGLPLAVLVALAVVAVGFGRSWARGHGPLAEEESGAAGESVASRRPDPQVDVVKPRQGGFPRMTVQPGSVYAFETVDLYAMVSGYLKVQDVDIGSRVRKGQVLAEIDVPREKEAVGEASAVLGQIRAQARQAESKVKSAIAERQAAAATLAQTLADVDRLIANRALADKQLARVTSLNAQNAIEKRVVDEEQHHVDSTKAAERTARLTVQTAEAQLATANARIEQARADVAEAEAAIGVAEARLARARVDVAYAKLVSSFDGVVTHRNFHPGAFISAATAGTARPLLTIVRTDLMRVVVRVPDRDVVLTNPGDPATMTIDALGGRSFQGTVARVADSEDHQTRTMRVEVDLPNPDGLIREGMYGRVQIGLEPVSRCLTVPVACVRDRNGKGRGAVQVVRDGRAHRLEVELGADDGNLIEIVHGLVADDRVVLATNVPLEEGMKVIARTSG